MAEQKTREEIEVELEEAKKQLMRKAKGLESKEPQPMGIGKGIQHSIVIEKPEPQTKSGDDDEGTDPEQEDKAKTSGKKAVDHEETDYIN